VQRGLPDGGDETQSRLIAANVGGLRVMNVYVPNGEAPGTGKFAYKLGWLERLRLWLLANPSLRPDVILGDFNVAPGDLDVFDPVLRRETIHCSTPEREALARLVAVVGYEDVLRRLHPDLRVFTFWDYRMLAFPKNRGFRIDHVFATPAVAARVTEVKVDREARKGQGASDHAPLVVDISS
jgi:exodeoxyribonuclease-3